MTIPHLNLSNIAKYLKKHEESIARITKFTSSCIMDANGILNGKNRNALHYLTFLFKTKNHYVEIFKHDVWKKYSDHGWKNPLMVYEMNSPIISLLQEAYKDRIIHQKADSGRIEFLILDELSIAWSFNNAEDANGIWVDKGNEANFFNLVYENIWKNFGNFVIVSLDHKDKDYITLSKNIDTNIISSDLAEKYCKNINKFLEKNIGRSLLFYGPPGTGKSNIVKNIASKLNFRTLKLNVKDFKRFKPTVLHLLLSIVKPDVVIIEDIDHATLNDDCQVLAVMETLNNAGKLVLATTNRVKSIGNAIIRCGRFDELIEINKFDETVLRSIVGNDEELYKIVENLPIASTMELMKRIEALGREEAIASIFDITKRFENMEKTYDCSL